jgi:glycosyltransferase involved in cell wall biosynthesis
MKPLVSIIITSYNYGKFIKTAIDSALNQSYKKIEIIVVDDGSTDDSPEIIKSYGNKIISVLKNNQGQSSAINAGFGKSSGSIICLLDSDDFFELDKIQKNVNIYENFPNVYWCYHPLTYVDNNNHMLCVYPPPAN